MCRNPLQRLVPLAMHWVSVVAMALAGLNFIDGSAR